MIPSHSDECLERLWVPYVTMVVRKTRQLQPILRQKKSKVPCRVPWVQIKMQHIHTRMDFWEV